MESAQNTFVSSVMWTERTGFVAGNATFEKMEKEDFGQTFGTMGIGEGCYLVLPVLGPSTVRDTVGSLISLSGGDAWFNVTVKNDTQYLKESDYYFSKLSQGVDFRAKNLESFDSLEKTSIDFYATVRSLYLQDRERKIKILKVNYSYRIKKAIYNIMSDEHKMTAKDKLVL